MVIPAIAGAITFIFTALLTIAGVGAAFILIPVFIALGIDIHVAMATALLLNSIAMIFASYRFIKNRLIMWKVAIPVLVVATGLSPVGAWVSQGLNRAVLLWLFVGFLLFAAGMMLFYKPQQKKGETSKGKQVVSGVSVGAFAGFLGGLLGVGGGNFIVPVLVWLGYNPKKASATTSFIVIFSSFSGFLGHATLGSISVPLLGLTAAGSALGAVVGAWLMTDKLKRDQVKIIIGVVLLGIAAKMIWNLLR
ncbi:MAG: sulfite exporter TauE/SafE family protein [Deltaproteobacteria bacterium]|nr:sulfite exporter TauE/SafE family protein [Deltaproteobacteria bacterium]MBW1950323.1 sulfite exporter TauE/SafE family protein [Deltaproteobacteria bacterium]MBW2009023.1 sulfite exporter TauE/SafE family protein [Deltaproteobacteria bacterium]MBW2348785.1 sulfite exporter TauE/SafE family protein [Deltaproteobacteria bacterium]